MRDYRAQLAGEKCWDHATQALLEARGEPVEDAILQNREELVALCQFIDEQRVRRYLEIGIWTGRLLCALHRIFGFDLVAACDHRFAERLGLPIRVPSETKVYWGDSASEGYAKWRETLGSVDLVFLDGSHAYHAVKRDFEINQRYPTRFIALHDITGATRQTVGVKRFWSEIATGDKVEIVRPHSELGLARSTMGIGIWSVGRGLVPRR